MVKRTYNDHTIAITGDYRFNVTGPLFDSVGGRSFDTMKAAEAAVDDRMKAVRKSNLKKLKLEVLIQTAGGPLPRIVTSINTNTSKLSGIGDDADEVYPVSNEIARLLKEEARLNGELRQIRAELKPYIIRVLRGYGRMGANEVDDKIQALVTEHAEKTAKALKWPVAS